MSVFVLILKKFRKEAVFFCFVRTRYCCTGMCVYVNLDFKRVNVEYARGTLNYSHNDTSSRTRGIQTVSRSCEYSCGILNR